MNPDKQNIKCVYNKQHELYLYLLVDFRSLCCLILHCILDICHNKTEVNAWKCTSAVVDNGKLTSKTLKLILNSKITFRDVGKFNVLSPLFASVKEKQKVS